MIFPVVMMSVLAAASPPKAPAGADVVTYVARLDALSQVLPFFEAASTRSALFRPSSWTSSVHPLIDVDVTDAAALGRVGIDATGSLTASRLGNSEISCHRVSDLDAYRKACDARLARLGDLFEKSEGGVSIYATRDPLNRVQAAYVISGKETCAIAGHGHSIEKELKALVKTVGKPLVSANLSAVTKLPGLVQVFFAGKREKGLSISANGLTLEVQGRAWDSGIAKLAGGGASPYSTLAAPGMAVVRGRLAKDQLAGVIDQFVQLVPGGSSARDVARELAPLMTGNAGALISHVKITTGLRTREARFFALKLAVVAEVNDPVAAAAVLEKLNRKALSMREGTLDVELVGAHLVVSNDGEAKAKLLAAVKTSAGKQGHGMEISLDSKAVAKGLSQIPLLEAMQAPELAGMVAASAELGPLLLATERVNGWIDSSGNSHVGRATWTLDAAKFAPDAGN